MQISAELDVLSLRKPRPFCADLLPCAHTLKQVFPSGVLTTSTGQLPTPCFLLLPFVRVHLFLIEKSGKQCSENVIWPLAWMCMPCKRAQQLHQFCSSMDHIQGYCICPRAVLCTSIAIWRPGRELPHLLQRSQPSFIVNEDMQQRNHC